MRKVYILIRRRKVLAKMRQISTDQDQQSGTTITQARVGLSLSLNAAPDPRADAAWVKMPGESLTDFSHTAHFMTA